MIPTFAPNACLPPGIHRATFAEFEAIFSRFDRSDRRISICRRIRQLFDEVRRLGFVKRMLVAGSFVTAKPEPNDFDCLLILDPEVRQRELRPFEYRVVSRGAARKAFGGDVIALTAGSSECDEYLEFFAHNRNGDRIGLVEIEL
jgi:hypothetical protein